MTDDATAFAGMPRAPERIPVWYWNRYVLLQLRAAVRGLLERAGAGASSRILEFGCGNRPYERVVQELGARYEGADLAGNPHADHTLDAGGRVPLESAQFDVVLSIQALEHVPDPAAYLAEARRQLKPGGKLVLSTHGTWIYHPSPGDYWRWTEPGLRVLLERNGFEVTSSQGLVGLVPGAMQLLQDQFRSRLPTPISRVFTTIMQALICALDRFHSDAARSRNALIYIVLARPAP